MKVVVLGGAGRFGRVTGWLLAESQEVTELVIADRDLGRLEALADQLGAKARAAVADVDDPASLDGLLSSADLVANTTGPYYRTLLPVLDAAIRNRAHYCDFSEEWTVTEQALGRDVAAKEAGIVALVGMGSAPGITNLLGVKAASRLDEVKAVDVGWCADIEHFGSVAENLDGIRVGRVSGVMQSILHFLAKPVYGIRNGQKARIDGQDRGKTVWLANGSEIIALPVRAAEPLTLHRALPDVPQITSRVGLLPLVTHPLLREQASRIASGADTTTVVTSLYEALAAEPTRWLPGGRDLNFGGLIGMATGTKDGQDVRVSIAPAFVYDVSAPGIESFDTPGPLALAALKILSGELSAPGVVAPEMAFAPDQFFMDLARRWCSWDGKAPLYVELSEVV